MESGFFRVLGVRDDVRGYRIQAAKISKRVRTHGEVWLAYIVRSSSCSRALSQQELHDLDRSTADGSLVKRQLTSLPIS